MIANRRRDTGPELEIRRLLHVAGLRYRVDVPLPFDRRRRADIVFSKVGLYVFIDGCFWHACPEHYVEPRSHPEYWQAKVRTNTARDADTAARLIAAGFHVLRIWEHEVPRLAAAEVEKRYKKLLAGLHPRARGATSPTRRSGSMRVTPADEDPEPGWGRRLAAKREPRPDTTLGGVRTERPAASHMSHAPPARREHSPPHEVGAGFWAPEYAPRSPRPIVTRQRSGALSRLSDLLSDYPSTRRRLAIRIDAASKNAEAVNHLLFVWQANEGPEKREVARAVAAELDVPFVEVFTPSEEALYPKLMNAVPRSIVFVPHIERLISARARQMAVMKGVLDEGVLRRGLESQSIPSVTVIGGTNDRSSVAEAFVQIMSVVDLDEQEPAF